MYFRYSLRVVAPTHCSSPRKKKSSQLRIGEATGYEKRKQAFATEASPSNPPPPTQMLSSLSIHPKYLALGLDSTRAARAPVVGYHSVYSGVKFWSDFYRSNDGHDKLVSAQTGYPLAAIVIFEVEQLLQMMVRETYTRFVQIFAG